MARTPRATAKAAAKWTHAELLEAKRSGMGPGVIGQEMFDAANALADETAGGTLGPALIYSSPEEAEAHGARHLLPVKHPDLTPAA